MFDNLKVKRLIKDRGRTRDWVARQARVEPDTLTHYLSGRRNPSAAVIALLAQALEVDEAELYKGSDSGELPPAA